MNRERHFERLGELRLRRALGDWDDAAAAELERLRPLGEPVGSEPDAYETAAAAVFLALHRSDEALPATLRRRLEATAPGHVDPSKRVDP